MSWNPIRPPLVRSARDRPWAKPHTIGLAAAAVVLAVLLYAWIDGGEEPLRPIAQPVTLPERAR